MLCTHGVVADPGTTRGVLDIHDLERPAKAIQLVGETGHALIPEGDPPGEWVFQDGVLTASSGWDSVITRDSYQDFRMHLEFNVNAVEGEADPEKNGNSGVYIQQRYELQILNSFGVAPEDKPNPEKIPLPIAWTKTWTGSQGKTGRVFHLTMGSARDYECEGLRRLTINAAYWCLHLEKEIRAERSVEIQGVYKPLASGFNHEELKVVPKLPAELR